MIVKVQCRAIGMDDSQGSQHRIVNLHYRDPKTGKAVQITLVIPEGDPDHHEFDVGKEYEVAFRWPEAEVKQIGRAMLRAINGLDDEKEGEEVGIKVGDTMVYRCPMCDGLGPEKLHFNCPMRPCFVCNEPMGNDPGEAHTAHHTADHAIRCRNCDEPVSEHSEDDRITCDAVFEQQNQRHDWRP